MLIQSVTKGIAKVLPPIVSIVSRKVSLRLGKKLVSHLPARIRNFVAIVHVDGTIRMKVYTGETIGRHMYYFHNFEQAQSESLLSLVDEKTVFFDTGANMGLYSFLAAEKGARVYSFEPSPSIVEWFEDNLELNSSLADRITLVQEAVSDHNGTLNFYPNREGNFGVGKIFSEEAKGETDQKQESNAVQITARTLDDCVKQYGVPDIIKMDVEGAEFLILKDLPEVFKREDAPTLFVEFHPHGIAVLGGTVDEIRKAFFENGFTCYQLNDEKPGETTWEVFSKRPFANKNFRIIHP